MVDPMWAGAANAPAARPDEAKAASVLALMIDTSQHFIARAAKVAGAGAANRFLPGR